MKEINKLEDIEDNYPYKDILNIKYPFSLIKERQDISIRAGQFAPFSALTGYDDQVKETERITDCEITLDDDKKNLLDKKINYIRKKINNIEVEVVYFIKDKIKKGGKYNTKTGVVHKIDDYKKEIIFKDKEKIKINNIIQIDIKNKA